MTTPVVVLTALASALAAAGSTVLQHRAARTVTDSPTGGGAVLLARVVRRPMWMAGLATAGVGLVLHAVALAGGHLALVQPLLVSGLLLALPASAALEGSRPSGRQVGWAAALTVALSALLVVGHPTGGQARAGSGPLAWAALVCVAAVALVTVAGLRVPGRRGALLGLAAGLAFGLASALLKQVTTVTPGGALLHWPTYGLLAAGAAALLLAQLAYRAAPLAASLPGLAVGDPVASVLLGVVVFHERVASGPLAVAVQVASFLLVGLAASHLAQEPRKRCCACLRGVPAFGLGQAEPVAGDGRRHPRLRAAGRTQRDEERGDRRRPSSAPPTTRRPQPSTRKTRTASTSATSNAALPSTTATSD